jgi:organic hydroperoxide reductase OsmC/OhrA
MMISPLNKQHSYTVQVRWTGNRGEGTKTYMAYSRDHEITAAGKPALPCSSDPAFRGDARRWNPEELLVASLSTCHMLWYLHLCADAGIVVESYVDEPTGVMEIVGGGGGGRFVRVDLRPRVRIADSARNDAAIALHHRAHELCFISNSVNFPVECEARVE